MKRYTVEQTKLGFWVVRTDHNRHRLGTRQEAEEFLAYADANRQRQYR